MVGNIGSNCLYGGHRHTVRLNTAMGTNVSMVDNIGSNCLYGRQHRIKLSSMVGNI